MPGGRLLLRPISHFWNYETWDGSAWQGYPVGASESSIQDGAIEGWRWAEIGVGSLPAAPQLIAAHKALSWLSVEQSAADGGYGSNQQQRGKPAIDRLERTLRLRLAPLADFSFADGVLSGQGGRLFTDRSICLRQACRRAERLGRLPTLPDKTPARLLRSCNRRLRHRRRFPVLGDAGHRRVEPDHPGQRDQLPERAAAAGRRLGVDPRRLRRTARTPTRPRWRSRRCSQPGWTRLPRRSSARPST